MELVIHLPSKIQKSKAMLTSLQNPLIKQIRKLHQAKGRHEQDLFLLEGTHLLETACEVNCSLVTLCFTPEWQERYPQLRENAAKLSQRVELVSPEILTAIATTVHPDGVVATVQRHTRPSPQLSGLNLGLVLERLQDPGNLGTIVRTAAATQLDGIWLSEGSADLDHPKVLRASAGAWFRVPMAVSPNLPRLIQGYQVQGVQIIGTLPKATQTYWDIDFTGPSLILLGNEGAGLSRELISLCDRQVNIPVGQGVESLNVAIAAALLLYEAKRQNYTNFL
jgi:TrmH family RNA methyltransferase